MSKTSLEGGMCAAATRFLDSCTSADRPSALDHEILDHIERCPACSKERDLRLRIAERLRRAVQDQVPDPYLASRIRYAIRARQSDHRRVVNRRWGRQFAAAAAVFFLTLGGWMAYELGHLRMTAGAQDAYIASISNKIAAVLGVGLGDHVHCAVYRRLPKQPPPLTELFAQLGPQYRGLLPIAQSAIPAKFAAVMAHQCSYQGRKFVHVVFAGEGRLLSLAITQKAPGESFAGQKAVWLSDSGHPLYQDSVQRFSVAAFESGQHLVYLVSDLDGRSNLDLLAALAGPVSGFLKNSEG